LALLRILNDLFRHFADRHVGSLRGTPQHVECLTGADAAPITGAR